MKCGHRLAYAMEKVPWVIQHMPHSSYERIDLNILTWDVSKNTIVLQHESNWVNMECMVSRISGSAVGLATVMDVQAKKKSYEGRMYFYFQLFILIFTARKVDIYISM